VGDYEKKKCKREEESEVGGGVDQRCEEEEVTPEEMRKRDSRSRIDYIREKQTEVLSFWRQEEETPEENCNWQTLTAASHCQKPQRQYLHLEPDKTSYRINGYASQDSKFESKLRVAQDAHVQTQHKPRKNRIKKENKIYKAVGDFGSYLYA
jgi:hypothetical protein